MAGESTSSYVSTNRPSSRFGIPILADEGSAPVPSLSYNPTLHSDQYPGGQQFAAALLSLLLRIVNPDMTKREELMIYGQKPAPGVSEDNLRSPGVSPLAIRRMA